MFGPLPLVGEDSARLRAQVRGGGASPRRFAPAPLIWRRDAAPAFPHKGEGAKRDCLFLAPGSKGRTYQLLRQVEQMLRAILVASALACAASAAFAQQPPAAMPPPAETCGVLGI